MCLPIGQALLDGPGRIFTIWKYFDDGNPGGVCESLKNVGSARFKYIRYRDHTQVR